MEAMEPSFSSGVVPQPALGDREQLLQEFDLYLALVANAGSPGEPDAEPCLGGQLVYIGELDAPGRSLAVASNVAGAASLSATADRELQRLVIREGLVDFVVNSLDEALRILKNEVRKKETVAVCVAQSPPAIEAEMQERGVLPDVLRESLFPLTTSSTESPAPAADQPPRPPAVVFWSVTSGAAQSLPRLDAIAAGCLPPNASAARRWLRLAPRYMGRSARHLRLLRADAHFAAAFREKVQAAFDAGEFKVPARIEVRTGNGSGQHDFTPGQAFTPPG